MKKVTVTLTISARPGIEFDTESVESWMNSVMKPVAERGHDISLRIADADASNSFVIQKSFEDSGNYNLFPEFIETLINEKEIPEGVRRKIWALASTSDSQDAERCAAIVASFQDSDGPQDLEFRWRRVISQYWPSYPDCPLRKELETL